MTSTQKQKTVTIFIPAYNEERNIEQAVISAISAVKSTPLDFEILILNACSSDKTGEIADRLAATNDKIKVIHRDRWFGLGANYLEGVRQATTAYFILFPGDNEITGESLAETLKMAGKADIIIPYTTNQNVRAIHRRVISKAFISVLNILFGLRLKYYNGNALYKTSIIKKLAIKSQDFAYYAEILIKLIKSGHSYHEIGMRIKPITNKTAIFKIKNVVGVIKTV
jgi:dolichol-phosphate mannosyltransferase